MAAPTVQIEGCSASHAVLLGRLAGLTDEQARRPSLLPDWTVGHVLTHIARNADSVSRRLEGASRGEAVDQYPGGYAGRAADIAAGAGRPAAELVADVDQSARRMEAACLAVPDDAWSFRVRSVSGPEQPAKILPGRRWREVELHHVDLGLGYRVGDWPTELVAMCLPRELERLAVRCDTRALLAWLTGRGRAPALGPWEQ